LPFSKVPFSKALTFALWRADAAPGSRSLMVAPAKGRSISEIRTSNSAHQIVQTKSKQVEYPDRPRLA
jgi:hypothetical protein